MIFQSFFKALEQLPDPRFRRVLLLGIGLTIALLFAVYALYLSISVIVAFEGRRWDIPARVYAAPLELYAGIALTPGDKEAPVV